MIEYSYDESQVRKFDEHEATLTEQERKLLEAFDDAWDHLARKEAL